jgi:hypothetical protein
MAPEDPEPIELYPPFDLVTEFDNSRKFKTLEKIAWGFSLAGRTDTRRSIHQQKVHGREIILAQDPALHLTWKDDTIFIKPLPASLTVNDIEEQGKRDLRVCGYLHSYTDSIQDPLDLQIAIELNLLPWRPFYENAQKQRSMAEQWASWDEIRNRINDLGHKRLDFSRHPRYEYGELRISQLNLLAICRQPWSYFFRAKPRHLEYWSSYSEWAILIFAFCLFFSMECSISRKYFLRCAEQQDQ